MEHDVNPEMTAEIKRQVNLKSRLDDIKNTLHPIERRVKDPDSILIFNEIHELVEAATQAITGKDLELAELRTVEAEDQVSRIQLRQV